MIRSIMVWGLETAPEVKRLATATNIAGKSIEEEPSAIRPGSSKLIYRSITCISSLVARATSKGYAIEVISSPHVGQYSEKELVKCFLEKVGQISPSLLASFNGDTFDMPVVRNRAML